MSKRSSLLTLALAILLIFISIRSASPPAVRTGEVPDSSFSVKRAYTHLLEISRLPHLTGTTENARVRNYIVAACKQSGFIVEIQNTTAVYSRADRVSAANVYNIIARKKGQHNSKAVILMAHYDSQLNTPGAGDDGAAVAAMLETIRALQKIKPLQNDLILLVTDGEEIGMLGANAFVKDGLVAKETGLVINFEGRGNAGPSNMFEVNDKNGWVINEYARSAAHHFANSLGYEIYKKLPNYTDFTLFKDAGIAGLNNAFIDGFVNYHSATDKPENIDRRSFQHHGDNMLSLVKHFGNLNITETKSPDVSYFNVIGSWFVHYPASRNLIFVLLTDLFFIMFMVAGIKNGKIKAGGFVIGTFLFPLVLTIIYFAAKWMLGFIISHYQLYTHFDENNSYNSAWYFLVMSELAVTLFSFIYWLAAKKINSNSLLAGILLIFVILMNAMQYAIPSASYLLFIPVLFILVIRLFTFSKKVKEETQSTQLNFLNLISVVPAICLLAPVVYSTFIAFALGNNMPFVTIAAGIVTGLLLPVLYPCFKNQKLLLPLIAFICLLGALLGGHLTSGYSQKQPLPSSLRYVLDADSSKAKWLSDFAAIDKWSVRFFNSGSKNPPGSSYRGALINDAPVLPLLSPVAVITKDTTDAGTRKLMLHLSPSRDSVFMINITIADSSKMKAVFINGKEARAASKRDSSWYRNISYLGVTGNGLDVMFYMEAGKKLDMVLSDRSVGLPVVDGFNTAYPQDIIPAQGGNSNTIQVRKHYVF